jgi:hypothetical protein
MSRVVWRKGHLISIETRTGIFGLAQMLTSPYLMFFNVFRSDNTWDDIDLAAAKVLFHKQVTSDFLQSSNIRKQTKLKPRSKVKVPSRWIHPRADFRRVTVWPGTSHQREVLSPDGASLVEIDKPESGKYKHPGGVYDRVLIRMIDPSDSATIDEHEINSFAVFPEMNERLYLCHQFGSNVDPEKSLLFDREPPTDFGSYFDILRGGGTARQQAKLSKLYEFSAD